MNENDGAEQTPCTALPINVKHSQYLQEPNASNGTRGKHLSIAAECENDQWCDHNYEIWNGEVWMSFRLSGAYLRKRDFEEVHF